MDNFVEKNIDIWERKDLYKLYTEVWTTICFSITSRLNVTNVVKACRERDIKLSAALIYAVCCAVNSVEEFRYAVRDGKLGVWDRLHPVYPVLNKNYNTTFHTIKYKNNFADFYAEYLDEQRLNKDMCGATSEKLPGNYFIVSIANFLNFESVSYDYRNATNYYSPLICIGKFSGNNKLTLPVSVTVNHAVVDGWHVRKFLDIFSEMSENAFEWCKLQ